MRDQRRVVADAEAHGCAVVSPHRAAARIASLRR
jgi:hypothetical protein